MELAIEKRIVNKLLRRIIDQGYLINIDNGGNCYELKFPTKNLSVIRKELRATGHDDLILFRNDTRIGFISLVWGNGEDVVSDYSCCLESIVVNN